MDWDRDSEGVDDEPKALLDAWLGDLAYYDRFMPERAAALREAGAPDPRPGDEYGWRMAYYSHHAAKGDEDAADMPARLRAGGGAGRCGSVSRLPRRIVRVEFGDGPTCPAVVYTAPPDVIARFVAALKAWNPEYKVEVEPPEHPEDADVPPLPLWRLWAWD